MPSPALALAAKCRGQAFPVCTGPAAALPVVGPDRPARCARLPCPGLGLFHCGVMAALPALARVILNDMTRSRAPPSCRLGNSEVQVLLVISMNNLNFHAIQKQFQAAGTFKTVWQAKKI